MRGWWLVQPMRANGASAEARTQNYTCSHAHMYACTAHTNQHQNTQKLLELVPWPLSHNAHPSIQHTLKNADTCIHKAHTHTNTNPYLPEHTS